MQWSECGDKAQASDSYLIQLEAAHYSSSLSECVSIFRPERCTVLDTKVRTQSAFINRHQHPENSTLNTLTTAKVTQRPDL